jgi:hypothetical protein
MNFQKEENLFIYIGLLFSLIFSSASLAIIFLSSATTFKCQRVESNQGICELKTVTGPFNWEQVRTFPLKELKEAVLVTRVPVSSRTRRNFYTRIVTEREEIPLPDGLYGPSENRTNLANEINKFIKNPKQKYLTVQEDDTRWESYIWGVFILLVSNWIIISLIIGMRKSFR